jgi:hypothetical protein
MNGKPRTVPRNPLGLGHMDPLPVREAIVTSLQNEQSTTHGTSHTGLGIAALGIVAGLVMLGIGYLFHWLLPSYLPAVPEEYRNETVFRPWSGWTHYYMFWHPIAFGVLFAVIFHVLHRAHCFTGRLAGPRGGALYGLLVFAIGSLPVFLLNYASFQVSPQLILWTWILPNLAQYLVAGSLLGFLYDWVRGLSA